MIIIKKAISFVLILLLFVGCKDENEQPIIEDAKYKVTFQAYWSVETHPFEFPAGPHFSGIIGLTHKFTNPIFATGQLATEGIKVMAEIGGKNPLAEEINVLIANKSAGVLISGGGISKSPGTVSDMFMASSEFPLITIVSMLAPSPDWFIAVANIALLDGDNWLTQKTVPVTIYDAGTDAGNTFQSPDMVENPQKRIELITSPPLASNGKVEILGEFVIELLEE